MDRIESAESVLARRICSAAPGRDVEAEASFYRQLAPRARLYGLKHLRDPHAASDLAQEVLWITIQKLREGAIRDPGRIASFVLGTCRQTVIDWKRGTRRREHLLNIFGSDLIESSDEVAVGGSREDLRLCMERLPDRERAVLLMTFFDERAADGIAQELRTSAANVRVIRHRGIERLRKCLLSTGEHR